MSYCRFSNDKSNSDLYMFRPIGNPKTILCMCCILTNPIKHILYDEKTLMDESFGHQTLKFNTPKDALTHLYEHKRAGHKIGRGAITRLKKEIKNEISN